MESDTQLECGVCGQSSDKKQQRLLPCQHNFCQQCLNRTESNQPTNEICCPVCKNRVKASAAGSYGIPWRSLSINFKKTTDKSTCKIHNENHIKPPIICSVCKSDILCSSCKDQHKPPKCRLVFFDHKTDTKKLFEMNSLKIDGYEKRVRDEAVLLRKRLKETEDDCYRMFCEKIEMVKAEIEKCEISRINEIKKLRNEIHKNPLDEKEMEKRSDNILKDFTLKQSVLVLTFDLLRKHDKIEEPPSRIRQPSLENIHKFKKVTSISADYGHCKYLNNGLIQIVYSKKSCSLVRKFKNGQPKQIFNSKLITDFIVTSKDVIYAIDESNKRILKSTLKSSADIIYQTICQVQSAWRLFAREDHKVSLVVISAPQLKQQQISLINQDKLEWSVSTWGEANLILTACILSNGNVLCVGNNCIVLHSGKTGDVLRINPWTTLPFEVYSVNHLAKEGFLLTKNEQPQITAYNNELMEKNHINLNFNPGEIQLTNNGTLYIKNTTNLSVAVYEII